MPITLFSHPDCARHQAGEHHPERPARLSAINDQLIRSGMEFIVQQKDATPATPADLYRVHNKLYVDETFDKAPAEGHIWLDAETQMSPGSLTAALYAAGSTINAVDQVMSGDNQQAFCAVRPPGHHACRDHGMGFCMFNNIAVAAAYAMDKYGLERITIVDFDVHHGNGTEDIFKDDPRVQLCSSFQQGLYPSDDDSVPAPHILNLPLPGGTKGDKYRQQVTEFWFGAIDAFQPQLILISAGFDSHAEDEMSQFLLKDEDYEWLSRQLKQLADKHCHGRMVSTLEGGYALSALGRSVVAHLKGML
ncbi:histone deacetylase family protein [Chromatiaceae bacterium AAb-1]|nr:histone deacetylase family protein [Chromatiaceae bacterium AAb-1]